MFNEIAFKRGRYFVFLSENKLSLKSLKTQTFPTKNRKIPFHKGWIQWGCELIGKDH